MSARVQRIRTSPTLVLSNRVLELRAQGRDIIGLGAGEPDFDTPEHIKQAAQTAIAQGETKYTPVGGTATLKQAIVDKFERDNGLGYAPDQILVSCGGKHSFFNLAMALLDTGDEVLIPAPYWVSYPDMVRVADATPVILPTAREAHFKITPAQLEAAITARTRLLVLNSPSNPSGQAYSQDELACLAEVLRKHPQIWVVTDDIYEEILWSAEGFSNLAMVAPDLRERCVVLNGVSKAYAMTGWRIGYAAGPFEVIDAMSRVQSQSTSNPCSVSQAAAVAALNGDQTCLQGMVEAYRQRHELVHAALNRLAGVNCLRSQGTFYVFPDVSVLLAERSEFEDDVGLAEWLLENAEVAVVPGSAFGSPGHLRLSFASSLEVLQRALERMEKALKGVNL